MLRPGHVIALCVLALLTIGVVMVNSAGMSVRLMGMPDQPQPVGVTPQTIILSRSTAYMGLSLAALAVGSFIPVRRLAHALTTPRTLAGWSAPASYRTLALGAVAIVLACALVYVPHIGIEKNGAHRWVGLPIKGSLGEALTFQPSELAKWGLVLLVAWYACVRSEALRQFWRGLVPALVVVGAVAAFVVLEDLGTGVLLAASACVVLLAAGARLWHFLLFVPLAAAGLVAAIIQNPYRIDRITAFLNPYADPEKTGYHMIQSLRAVADGGGFGRGLGHGMQKMGYLPEDRTDFIFAVICEELGVAGAGVVIALFACLAWSTWFILRRETNQLLRLFGLGVITTVGVQAVINLAVVTGLAPTKGIALPMLSSGGTGWILTAFSLGLVMAIDRSHAELAPESPTSPEPGSPRTDLAPPTMPA